MHENTFNIKRISSLDGLRAAAVLIVAWFHIWQQSWLTPRAAVPVFAPIGETVLRLELFPRTGYLFVDFLLVLSAFCLFLPYARHAFGEKAPDGVKTFYKKRIARIVPSYFIAVIICFGYSVVSGAYSSAGSAAKDLLSTLTFTQTFSPQTLLASAINGVLWTAAVEMQFYAVFPLLAKWFRGYPFITYCTMVLCGEVFLRAAALGNVDGLRMTVNQMPAFLGLFANGMLAAYVYVAMAKKLSVKAQSRLSVAGVVGFLLALVLMTTMLSMAAATRETQVWQAEYRLALGVVFTMLILFAAMSGRWLSWLLGNRLMGFLAAISYNFYIWHQWLAVKLKAWRIPFWEGEKPPNFTGDIQWQWEYTLLAFGAAFLAAFAFTYFVEKPAADRLLGRTRLDSVYKKAL